MKQTANFGDLPEAYSSLEKAKVVILPVPYDGTSTWLKGADKGPAAVIEASAYMELYDIETNSQVYQHGIFTAEPVDEGELPEQMVKTVHKRVHDYILILHIHFSNLNGHQAAEQ